MQHIQINFLTIILITLIIIIKKLNIFIFKFIVKIILGL